LKIVKINNWGRIICEVEEVCEVEDV
jgi:hypothetical protein